MTGGLIVQIVGDAVEVLCQRSLDRSWRKLERPGEVRVGDALWWQSYKGYLARYDAVGDKVFADRNIGRCEPCNAHGRVPKVKIQGEP